VRRGAKNVFKGQLTVGLDLGDRFSSYCVLDENGEIILERNLPTTPEAMKQTFGRMLRSRIAMETGTHSPWVSRVLTELGHEVIVAHAQQVRLIVKSRRKDDRLDARTLARLARIDPELLTPVQHRSAQAQLHLAEIRARAGLVSARTALVNAARGLVKSYGQRLRKCGTLQVSREIWSRCCERWNIAQRTCHMEGLPWSPVTSAQVDMRLIPRAQSTRIRPVSGVEGELSPKCDSCSRGNGELAG